MADDFLFDRTCDVTINTLKLKGHDVEFEIFKTIKPEPNTCTLRVWGLTDDQRGELEELRPKKNETGGIPVRVEAGFQGRNSLLFLGDLRDVVSVKEGPEWITELGSGDGEKAYGGARVNTAYGPATGVDTAIRAIVRALGIKEGNVSQTVARLKTTGIGKLMTHGIVISGPAARQMTDWARSADLEWSIQDGAIQFTDRGKPLLGTAIKLGPDTGMVDSPTVDNDGILKVRMLMIPDVRPGALLVMNAARVKGGYRILTARWLGSTFNNNGYIDVEAERY